MSFGLIALLDDVAAIARVAAASLDDVVGQATKAGVKAAGVVIDDAAVTPRYAVGFAPERELPIVGKIALGSLRNKLLILLPIALVLGVFSPWAVTPLLMVGGAYLCYEGAEKVVESFFHGTSAHSANENFAPGQLPATPSLQVEGLSDPACLENQRVASAIRTDLILSAEIMAITLGSIQDGSFWRKAVILAVVGVFITIAVYGAVALIVKADDAGLALARLPGRNPASVVLRAFGRLIVLATPYFLDLLSVVGTAAMIWVGGAIIIHGLESFGLVWLGHFVHDASAVAARLMPDVGGFASWACSAVLSGVFGLFVGFINIAFAHFIFFPLVSKIRG